MSQSQTLYEGFEAVRRRPGMYIGGTDQRALNCCVFELIANSMEEHLAGRGSAIAVTLHDDGSLSVKDEGGGISVTEDPELKHPFIQLAMTTVHFPGNHLKQPYRVLRSSGVGAKCVNAVSEWMRIHTFWGGFEHRIAFARGRLTEPLMTLPGTSTGHGTIVRFKPDPEIFQVVNFDRSFLAAQLDHLAALHPKLAFCLVDERPNIVNRPLVSLFHYPNGIADFLKLTCPVESRRHPEPVALNGDAQGIKIALGFQFTEPGNIALQSFANSSPTRRGGTHVQGFLQGLADTFNELARPQQAFRPNEMRAGLNAFVGAWLRDPHYGGSFKDELIDPEVAVAVRELTSSGRKRWAAESGEHAGWLAAWLEQDRHADPEAEEG